MRRMVAFMGMTVVGVCGWFTVKKHISSAHSSTERGISNIRPSREGNVAASTDGMVADGHCYSFLCKQSEWDAPLAGYIELKLNEHMQCTRLKSRFTIFQGNVCSIFELAGEIKREYSGTECMSITNLT